MGVRKKTAADILTEKVATQGEGVSRYTVEIEDLRILILAGAREVCIDHDDDNGKFFSEVEYEGRFFACTSTEEVGG